MSGLLKRLCIAVLALLCMTAFICGCGANSADGNSAYLTESHKVLVTMESGDTFTIETLPEYAPETCNNFLSLVEDGFYNGLTFHRVIDAFVAQAGDPNGDGTGGSAKSIKGEFAQNGFEQNTLSHTRGVISMARRGGEMDSATSQFFICYDDVTFLDGQYAAFGRVTEGMENVDKFLETERDSAGMPASPIVIKEMKIIK